MLSDGTYNPITTTEIAGASTESQSKQNQDKSEIQSVKNRLQTNYALFKRTPSHSPRVVALPPNSDHTSQPTHPSMYGHQARFSSLSLSLSLFLPLWILIPLLLRLLFVQCF